MHQRIPLCRRAVHAGGLAGILIFEATHQLPKRIGKTMRIRDYPAWTVDQAAAVLLLVEGCNERAGWCGPDPPQVGSNDNATLLGGRSAEEIVFGKITTGAANDLQRATDIAEQMVGTYGMSDTLGPLAYDKQGGGRFLGGNNNPRRAVSDATA